MSISHTLTLDIQERSIGTKGSLSLLRREGRIPAILYGQNQTPQTISLSAKEMKSTMQVAGFRTRIFQTTYGPIMIKHIEFPPVKDVPLHIDLIRLGEKVDLNIPLSVTNREASPGIKKGGIVNMIHSSIRVRSLTQSIPSVIEVNLKGLEIGQGLKVKDLILPEGVQWLHATLDETIINIVAPTVSTEAKGA